jgi:lysophospholipase L1-like esterase
MSKRMVFLVLGVTSTLAACSSTTVGPSPAVTPVEDASTSIDAAGADAGNGTPKVCPTSVHKTIVVVGDSISDVGSGETRAQQEPFYRTLLVKNDEERHADWKGYDLSTCWKLDATKAVVKASVGGAIATEKTDGERSILLQQAKSLPTSLEGPVLVVGTIGGNDLLSGLSNVVFGNTEKAKTDLDAYVSGFGAAMAELTKPDRFGAGVKVDVLITNIFDPSDGTGRFRFTPEDRKCTGAFQLWPEGQPTEPTLVEWNSAMTAEAAKYRGVALLDLKALYKGHDVNQAAENNWFYKDCIHPNSAGHHGIRTLFWKGIVGLK